MMDKVNPALVAMEIEKNTRLGSKELQACHIKKALEHFSLAYKDAIKTNDTVMLRACAFNLGAVHIADRNPQKGIQYLQKAIPPADIKDGHSNGDLYYNFGLGYELLDKKNDAVKYYELSLEDYEKDKDRTMAAEVATKIGAVYLSLEQELQSARAFGIASASYAALSEPDHQAQCLAQQARALLKANKVDDTIHIADDCMLVCQKVPQTQTLGKIYNDLGLIYTQCADYSQAQTCFELALPLSRGPQGDKRQQAVTLQNLGAVYNSTCDYQRALSFHESATVLYAELNNRGAQGQCFINLAFAYSRLGDTESAGECYLHALQAAKDTQDQHGQWQAMEGLGSVHIHNHNVHRAIKYFQGALATLSGSGEHNAVAQERLVTKLRDALEHELSDDSVLPSLGGSPLPININDLPRPSTRLEEEEFLRLRELRQERVQELKKIPYDFDRIALGLGAYDTDSDISVPKHRRHRPRPPSFKRDEVDRGRSSRQNSHDRRRSASERRARDDRDYGGRYRGRDRRRGSDSTLPPDGRESRLSEPIQKSRDYSGTEQQAVKGKKAPVKRLSRRQSTRKNLVGEEGSRRQAYLAPLLRPESYDSEEEWRKQAKRKKGYLASGERRYQDRVFPFLKSESEGDRYRPRVRPPSTEESDNTDIETPAPHSNTRGRSTRDSRAQVVRRRQSKSDSDIDPTSLQKLQQEEQRKRKTTLASIPLERPRTRRPTDTTETDQELLLGDDRSSTPGSRNAQPLTNNDRLLEGSEEAETVTEDDTPTENGETEDESEFSIISYDQLNDTDAKLSQYHEQMLQKDREDGATGSEGFSQTDSGSETVVETETEASHTLGPPAYTAPHPPDAQRPLNTTYEHPVDAVPSTSKQNPNAPMKRSVEDPNDPTYQTIRSLVRTQPSDVASTPSEIQAPPELPPRPLNQMSIGEQEEFLKNYRQHQVENSRDNVGRPPDGDDVQLPARKKGKATSKACVVM